MLKIIPTPNNPISKYTIQREIPTWIHHFGVFFEYEDDLGSINFQFLCTPYGISILEGPWVNDYTKEEIEAFYDTLNWEEEFIEWIDNEVEPVTVLKKLPKTNSKISGIWKMTDTIYWPPHSSSKELSEYYYEFLISTVTIRCMPYQYKLRFTVSDERNKLYWFTLCLLKYQRQLRKQSEE